MDRIKSSQTSPPDKKLTEVFRCERGDAGLAVCADETHYYFYKHERAVLPDKPVDLIDGMLAGRIPWPGCATADVDRGSPYFQTSRAEIRKLCGAEGSHGMLSDCFPAGVRQDLFFAWRDLSLALRVHEKLPIELRDIHSAQNLEIRRRAIEAYGPVLYMRDVGNVHDRDGENALFTYENRSYVFLKDSTTSKHYVLRVPRNFRTVREAIAWTFGMTPDEYDPRVET